MANLVICCDGTWNTPDDQENGILSVTNVVKIYNAIAAVGADRNEQLKYYHSGVGTEGGRLRKVLDGAVGSGLDNNLKSAYKWLATKYRDGDQIYLFGFSRGAYTVRSLAGMVTKFGLLDITSPDIGDDDIWLAVGEVFNLYANARQDRKSKSGRQLDGRQDVAVHFLGVWDTVGALGIPQEFSLLNMLSDPDRYRFHDTELNEHVLNARHAVAIDEMRETFAPTLWTGVEDRATVKQLWFPGVHSDVGGGYLEAGLSDGALKWMIEEAGQCGLKFRTDLGHHISPDPLGFMHDSRCGIFAHLRCAPRSVPFFPLANKRASAFHDSAVKRHQNPPLSGEGYWAGQTLPLGKKVEIDVFARERWNRTGIFVEAGNTYHFHASGQWMDSSIKCGPNGTQDGNFQLAELAHLAGSTLGRMEQILNKLRGEKDWDFYITRRLESAPWFSLVGHVADNSFKTVTDKGTSIKKPAGDEFLIGAETHYRCKADGYLYLFANDAWNFYENNKGSVRVSVECIG